MFKENEVVKDQNGVCGIILDMDSEASEELSLGILFTDVDENNGLWWTKPAEVKKVNKGTKAYNSFMQWYTEYQEQFSRQ